MTVDHLFAEVWTREGLSNRDRRLGLDCFLDMSTALGIPSRYAFFALAAMSVMMFSIDATIVAVALPAMMRDLNTSLCCWLGLAPR